jgi:hypothetical protein
LLVAIILMSSFHHAHLLSFHFSNKSIHEFV